MIAATRPMPKMVGNSRASSAVGGCAAMTSANSASSVSRGCRSTAMTVSRLARTAGSENRRDAEGALAPARLGELTPPHDKMEARNSNLRPAECRA